MFSRRMYENWAYSERLSIFEAKRACDLLFDPQSYSSLAPFFGSNINAGIPGISDYILENFGGGGLKIVIRLGDEEEVLELLKKRETNDLLSAMLEDESFAFKSADQIETIWEREDPQLRLALLFRVRGNAEGEFNAKAAKWLLENFPFENPAFERFELTCEEILSQVFHFSPALLRATYINAQTFALKVKILQYGEGFKKDIYVSEALIMLKELLSKRELTMEEEEASFSFFGAIKEKFAQENQYRNQNEVEVKAAQLVRMLAEDKKSPLGVKAKRFIDDNLEFFAPPRDLNKDNEAHLKIRDLLKGKTLDAYILKWLRIELDGSLAPLSTIKLAKEVMRHPSLEPRGAAEALADCSSPSLPEFFELLHAERSVAWVEEFAGIFIENAASSSMRRMDDTQKIPEIIKALTVNMKEEERERFLLNIANNAFRTKLLLEVAEEPLQKKIVYQTTVSWFAAPGMFTFMHTYLREELGEDAAKWEIFETLSNDFSGTFEELVVAAKNI